MSYQHGAYGKIGDDKVKSAVQVDTVVAYIGTAPINLVFGYKEKGLVNTPSKQENMPKTQATVGYSDNWDKFTLCEAFDCHFANTIENVGPIYVINVLDPATHQKDTKTTVELTFKNGRAEYASDTIILDTFALSDKVLGADYSNDYNYTKGTVVIESLNDEDPLTGALEASFSEVDPDQVTKDDIIGSVTAGGKRTGLQALYKLYTMHNAVLNLLAAPFWSEDPDVYKAMIAIVQKLNGHWDGFVNADLPLYDKKTSKAIDTIAKAEEWAEANGYTSGFSKVYWPQVKYGDRVYHLTTQPPPPCSGLTTVTTAYLWRARQIKKLCAPLNTSVKTQKMRASTSRTETSSTQRELLPRYFGAGSGCSGDLIRHTSSTAATELPAIFSR